MSTFPAIPPVCRHCGRKKVNRPRGLCWPCYYTPGVKEKYPSTSKYARRGVGNLTGVRPLPVPTKAPPGSPEKVAVLEERAKAGQALWHESDIAPQPVSRRKHSPHYRVGG